MNTNTNKVTTGIAVHQILVVDDNQDAAMTLSMLLRLKKYDVHTRYSGEEALVAMQQLQPDAVLLDIGMPGLNGYETCERIRQQPGGKDVVVIALTGYSQEEDRQRTRAAGFNAHLVKPVDLTVLTQSLTSFLSGANPV